jgi:hypothetical protein
VNDLTSFARLIHAIQPWRAHLVLAGGWAHRLHRFHPLAKAQSYQPIATKDTDIVFGTDAPLEGDIRDALSKAAFKEELSGEYTPPVTHYTLGDEGAGFYAEFLTPLRGSGIKRNGEADATITRAGVTAQKLRHLDLLLVEPWSMRIGADQGIPLPKPTDILVANPAAFIVQKLLIQKHRKFAKQAQDVLYIHDTIELFGGAIGSLKDLWRNSLAPTLGSRAEKRVVEESDKTFSSVTDVIREAARIPQDRTVTPEGIITLCAVGLKRILH